MKHLKTIILPFLFLTTLNTALAQETTPTEEQTAIKWGNVSEENGVRKVVSTEAEYNSHKQHGPITCYHVPFTDCTFSFSWKRDLPQKINLVFETEENGKRTHLFKVFINGRPTKDNAINDVISFVTYESIPDSKKKKATVTTEKYHAEAGEWHTTSVNFDGSVATIRVDDKTFKIEDDRLRNKVIQCGVGHIWGTLETKDVTVTKN